MSDADTEAERFVPSATVLLLRDGPAGLQVFMVARHQETVSFAGALVFPGGKVDAADASPALLHRCRGADPADPLLAFRCAAVREAFEECGVLLAARAGADRPLPAAELPALEARWRQPLARGETTLEVLCRDEDLVLLTDLLVPFSHWVTPRGRPRIFDTHFFLAPAPDDQVALHDGGEVTDSFWIEPSRAFAEAEAGSHTLVFPTRMNLRMLAESATEAAALESARRRPVVTVRPVMRPHAEGHVLNIPAEAGYGLSRMLVTRDGRFVPQPD